MMRVTGPMNVQMKWLSTLSQHLQEREKKKKKCWFRSIIRRSHAAPLTTPRPKSDLDDGDGLGARGKLLGAYRAHDFSLLMSLRL